MNNSLYNDQNKIKCQKQICIVNYPMVEKILLLQYVSMYNLIIPGVREGGGINSDFAIFQNHFN